MRKFIFVNLCRFDSIIQFWPEMYFSYYIYDYIYIYVFIIIYICVCAYMYTLMHIYTYIHTCMCVYNVGTHIQQCIICMEGNSLGQSFHNELKD